MNAKISYQEKLQDPRWQKMRLQVFERDEWKCLCCDADNKPLHAHHKFYRPYTEGPWDCNPSDLVTLCSDCHDATHKRIDAATGKLTNALLKAGFDTDMIEFLAKVFDVPQISVDEQVHFIVAISIAMNSRGNDAPNNAWKVLLATSKEAIDGAC